MTDPGRRARLQACGLLFAAALVLQACGESGEPPAPPPPPEAPAPADDSGGAPSVPPAPADDSGGAPSVPPAPAPDSTPGDAAAGSQVYAVFCATCHGATGDAQTPIAQTLDPPPVAHNNGAYMNGLSDAYLFRVVKEGGAAVGKSPNMAPWGGALTDQQIRDVVAFVRTLAAPPYEPPTP